MSTPLRRDDEHMNETEVAAYLDRRLPAGDRDRVERHLAGCDGCRIEINESHLILTRLRRRKLLVRGGLLLATAAVLLVVMRPVIVPNGRNEVSPLRQTDRGSPLIAYGPTGEVVRGTFRFVWGAAPAATTYRLTVSGSDGIPVWSGSATDTVLTLPDSVQFQIGSRYFWVADGLLSDGSSRTTGLHEFLLVQ